VSNTALSKKKEPTFVNPRDFMGSYAPDFILALPSSKLRVGPKLVYIVLSRRFNRQRQKAWPSLPAIARMCGPSARQVRRHIETLAALGFLHVTPTGRSNVYRFPWHSVMVGAKLRPKAVTRPEDNE
jgi:hypothetical protein